MASLSSKSIEPKHIIIGLAILVVGLVGYHYYAASVAAGQIDEALQEQSQKAQNRFSLDYSDIDVHPFSGDINFQDIRLTRKDYLYGASSLNFDLTYLDFLRFYAGGTDYGLKKLHQGKITALQPSAEIQSIARKMSADTLIIDYEGNMYDLLRFTLTSQPAEHEHHLHSTSHSVVVSDPGATWGGFRLDSLDVETNIPENTNSFLNTEYLTAAADRIRWIPPDNFQKQYEFFIRGFGYQPDSIAIDSVRLNLRPGNRDNRKAVNAVLYTDLFQVRSSATIRINYQSPYNSVFEEGTVNIPELSERFQNFLKNSEQLFGISIPQRRKNILQFYGPLTNPKVSLGGTSNSP